MNVRRKGNEMKRNEIKLGQTLSYWDTDSRGFYKAFVVGFTEKKVRVDISWKKGKRVNPENLFLQDKK